MKYNLLQAAAKNARVLILDIKKLIKMHVAAIHISTENVTMALIINLWKFLLTFSEILVICCNLLQNHGKIAATHSNLIDVDIIQHCTVRVYVALLSHDFEVFPVCNISLKEPICRKKDLFSLKNQ